jgi:hypothetical protein
VAAAILMFRDFDSCILDGEIQFPVKRQVDGPIIEESFNAWHILPGAP